MGCSSREEIIAVFDVLDAALDRLCELSFDVLTTPERLRALERLERGARRTRTPQHALINPNSMHKPARKSWAVHCARRWPTGCESPRPKQAGGSPKQGISGNAAH
jgi:hypothetical protein